MVKKARLNVTTDPAKAVVETTIPFTPFEGLIRETRWTTYPRLPAGRMYD